MDKTALNAQLVTSRLKQSFYHLKSVDCERSDVWKNFALVANEKNEQIDFAAYKTCLQASAFLGQRTGASVLRRHKYKVLAGQPSVMAFIPDAKKNQISPINKQQVASKCVVLVCRDIRPFDIFGDEGFKDFVEEVSDDSWSEKKFSSCL